MKAFLEMLARDAELAERAVAMSAGELKELARARGIELTDGDFEQGAGAVSDDELNAVAGGADDQRDCGVLGQFNLFRKDSYMYKADEVRKPMDNMECRDGYVFGKR